MFFEGNLGNARQIPIGGLYDFNGLMCALVYPSCRYLRFSGTAYFEVARVGQIDDVGLQLYFFFVIEISILLIQMRDTQFGAHDPVAGGRDIEKTAFTESLSIDRSVFATVQALIFDETDGQRLVEYLIHVQKIILKKHIILNRMSDFGFHFS